MNFPTNTNINSTFKTFSPAAAQIKTQPKKDLKPSGMSTENKVFIGLGILATLAIAGFAIYKGKGAKATKAAQSTGPEKLGRNLTPAGEEPANLPLTDKLLSVLKRKGLFTEYNELTRSEDRLALKDGKPFTGRTQYLIADKNPENLYGLSKSKGHDYISFEDNVCFPNVGDILEYKEGQLKRIFHNEGSITILGTAEEESTIIGKIPATAQNAYNYLTKENIEETINANEIERLLQNPNIPEEKGNIFKYSNNIIVEIDKKQRWFEPQSTHAITHIFYNTEIPPKLQRIVDELNNSKPTKGTNQGIYYEHMPADEEGLTTIGKFKDRKTINFIKKKGDFCQFIYQVFPNGNELFYNIKEPEEILEAVSLPPP